MKNIIPPTKGKMLVHGKGAGILTNDDVTKRAEELAEIADHVGPGKDDRRQAAREFEGDDLPDESVTDSDSERALTRDPSEPVSNLGHQVPNIESTDDQKNVEQLVNEGVEEAQHEQMLADRHRRHS